MLIGCLLIEHFTINMTVYVMLPFSDTVNTTYILLILLCLYLGYNKLELKNKILILIDL